MAPQVQAAAKMRLAALVDPAIGVLHRAMKKPKPDGVALGAAKDVLDRAGYKPADKFEHTGPDGNPIQIAVLYRNADGSVAPPDEDE